MGRLWKRRYKPLFGKMCRLHLPRSPRVWAIFRSRRCSSAFTISAKRLCARGALISSFPPRLLHFRSLVRESSRLYRKRSSRTARSACRRWRSQSASATSGVCTKASTIFVTPSWRKTACIGATFGGHRENLGSSPGGSSGPIVEGRCATVEPQVDKRTHEAIPRSVHRVEAAAAGGSRQRAASFPHIAVAEPSEGRHDQRRLNPG